MLRRFDVLEGEAAVGAGLGLLDGLPTSIAQLDSDVGQPELAGFHDARFAPSRFEVSPDEAADRLGRPRRRAGLLGVAGNILRRNRRESEPGDVARSERTLQRQATRGSPGDLLCRRL